MPQTGANNDHQRPGVYARGSETVDAIIKAALKVIIDEGAAAFSIRRIGAECGLRVGNVSYHFPRKELLVKVMLDELMAGYQVKLDDDVRQAEVSDEDRLRRVIVMCLEDICTKRTTRLFTELWSLGNQSAYIAERVELFYSDVHEVIGEQIKRLNGALDDDEVHTLALFISSSMEGTTPFLGFEKPWRAKMPQVTALSVEFFIRLAKSLKPGEIAELTKAIEFE
ncbi:TetR/AcrR family transcriptional regulator [Novosphingobium sp. 1949]|uniref:TetR/AcrR family transcriptional regulator n=1 Tax=Novosphingobium organovorum TaxID=2930092 RepID=A0ABT0BFV4_9SPHN|nr:TetR family transcriptional regulator [Novosphingobium organovorum]MCJ2183795.1 TetR/AcrR family transcriptional regulator [Novosphingobium organovorum]